MKSQIMKSLKTQTMKSWQTMKTQTMKSWQNVNYENSNYEKLAKCKPVF